VTLPAHGRPDPPLILASASPRRRELLQRLGAEFAVHPVDIAEEPGTERDPQVLARRLAREKAEAARLLFSGSVIIAADTVVWHDGESLGKPIDEDDARRMLRLLSGNTHDVVTAVAVIRVGGTAPMVRHPVTRVTLRDLGAEEIEASILRRDPFDKAGSYGIQDTLLRPVSAYEGCYCNVVGLPLYPAIELLIKCGAPVDSARVNVTAECSTCPLRSESAVVDRFLTGVDPR
jgi:septum formation protein